MWELIEGRADRIGKRTSSLRMFTIAREGSKECSLKVDSDEVCEARAFSVWRRKSHGFCLAPKLMLRWFITAVGRFKPIANMFYSASTLILRAARVRMTFESIPPPDSRRLGLPPSTSSVSSSSSLRTLSSRTSLSSPCSQPSRRHRPPPGMTGLSRCPSQLSCATQAYPTGSLTFASRPQRRPLLPSLPLPDATSGTRKRASVGFAARRTVCANAKPALLHMYNGRGILTHSPLCG